MCYESSEKLLSLEHLHHTIVAATDDILTINPTDLRYLSNLATKQNWWEKKYKITKTFSILNNFSAGKNKNLKYFSNMSLRAFLSGSNFIPLRRFPYNNLIRNFDVSGEENFEFG